MITYFLTYTTRISENNGLVTYDQKNRVIDSFFDIYDIDGVNEIKRAIAGLDGTDSKDICITFFSMNK